MRISVCVLLLFNFVTPLSAEPLALREISVPNSMGLVPRHETGAWRTHVQLVWDRSKGALTRRTYRLFDPFADQGFDLFWEPRDPGRDASGDLDGEGILTWRTPGSFRHSELGIRAQFIGTMQAGRAHGFGRYLSADGMRYTGQWRDGLMQGTGHLVTSKGDALTGQFVNGVPNGPGELVHASGATFTGPFTPGAPQLAQDFLADGLSIALSVGGETRFCCGYSDQEMPYTSLSEPGRLSIFPDDPALLDQWRGRGNVVISEPEAFDWARAARWQYSFLNYHENMVTTLPLRFGLGNATTQDVQVASAYLEVDLSRVDAQPMIQSIVLLPLSPYNTAFSIENYGWSTATEVRLNAQFIGDTARSETFQVDIPDVDNVGDFSLAPVLESFGVATERLPEVATACSQSGGQDCPDRIRNSGIFGNLAPLLTTNRAQSNLGLMISGTLSYSWQDADGQAQRTDAPFEGRLPLATLVSRAECEGGDFEQVDGGRPFDLRLDAASYRINLPLFGPVNAGEERRWEVLLDAEKSSGHEMRVVIRLADGREVVSRDVSALMFNPRHYDADIRPFEPRC